MVDKRFFPFAGPMTLSELCGKVGVTLAPDDARGAIEISGAHEPALAGPGDIALVAQRKYAADALKGRASVYITAESIELDMPNDSVRLDVSDPHQVFARMLATLFPDVARSAMLSVVSETHAPRVEDNVTISATAAFGPDVEIGAGSVIGPGAFIGRGVTIGRNSVIGPNVSVECAHIGDGVVLFAGARIGCDGFGWLDQGKTNLKIPQLGRVLIQDRVEIGANSTVDRGALGDTVIGEGTKIDNLVQIGHNCKIGRNCLIAAMSGLSGTTELGDGVLMGGNAATAGHLTVGAGSIVRARAAVSKNCPPGSDLAGVPAQDIKDFWRELALIRRLAKGEKT